MKNKEDFEKEQEDRKRREQEKAGGDANRDPISGEPGAHPVGVAAGGTGGAVAGAAIGGAIGGPVGAAIGGVVGAVAGGASGKLAAEAVNPTEEDRYWRENYQSRSYFKKDRDYVHYEPAYRYGWETASRPEYTNRNFEDIESNLQNEWATYRGDTQTEWSDARFAAKDAYDRIRSRFGTKSTGEQFGQQASATARNAGEYASDKASSFWDQVKGNWKQFKGTIKEKWNELTDDEIDQMEGRKDRIIGKIQEKYGESKWKEADIERELRANTDRRS